MLHIMPETKQSEAIGLTIFGFSLLTFEIKDKIKKYIHLPRVSVSETYHVRIRIHKDSWNAFQLFIKTPIQN